MCHFVQCNSAFAFTFIKSYSSSSLNSIFPGQVLTIKSLDAFAKAADGKATKLIIPSDIAGVAGLVSAISETAKVTKE